MNKKRQIALKYVGLKLSEYDPAMAQAKAVQGEQNYLAWLGSMKVSHLKPDFKATLEALIRKRHGVKPHRCVFYNPTVKQWVTDLLCKYTQEDVLDVFAQASGLSKEAFRKGLFGKNLLTRPLIEDLVDLLEQATGKKLTDVGYKKDEDTYSYLRIAEFFANV